VCGRTLDTFDKYSANHIESGAWNRQQDIGIALAKAEVFGDAASQNVTIHWTAFIGRLAMPEIHQPEQTTDDGATGAAPACMALVRTTEPLQRSAKPVKLSRPDPSFLTHLIATAEQVPQTRNHRRAEQADALSAYRAHQPHVQETGFRTRQVV
jgi:hypothetical protein